MNKLLAWCFLIIILLSGGIYLYRNNLSKNVEIVNSEEEIQLIDEFYRSQDGKEAWVTFAGKDVFLSLIDTEYENIVLSKVQNDSENKFENIEQNIVLLEKSPELFVYKNNEVIFSGKEREVVFYEKLINNVWVWSKTYKGTGLDADINNPIEPKRFGDFKVDFSEDGSLSGNTDCNSFTGTYKLDNGEISFGSFALTEKFCAESQEVEFLEMIKDGSYSFGSQNFYIENENTVVFNILE
jgi:heat shock protein HslJ